MQLTQKEKDGFSIRKARHGRGVFARRAFRSGTTLFQFRGTLMTCYADEDIDETIRANTIRFSDELFLSPGNSLGNFVNHSCAPNARIVKKSGKLFFVSLKPIETGEEITFDYSTILARDDVWQMRCDCTSARCRSTVKRFASLPKKLRERYIAEKIVPQYILDI